MSEEFFQYIARIIYKFGDELNQISPYISCFKVRFADPTVLRLIRKFKKIKTQVPYEARFRFVYGQATRYNVVLKSSGEWAVYWKKKDDIAEETATKILKEFFGRFYNIDIEIILQKLINFPPERSLPPKLKLTPIQRDVFLSTLERELNNGMNNRKIVIVSHANLIKKCQLMAIKELRDFLKEMFTDDCQIFLDYEELVKQPLPKKVEEFLRKKREEKKAKKLLVANDKKVPNDTEQ